MIKTTLAALLAVLAMLVIIDVDPLTRAILAALFIGLTYINVLAEKARRRAAWRSRYKR